MKNSLLMLAGAAALTLASCSQEKTTEVSTVPADGTTTTTTTMTSTTTPMSEADIQARAQRVADKMMTDMKITDAAMKDKIRNVYVNRYNRMNEMRTKYGTDTTGMAASMREYNTSTDTEFKSVFTDPAQYSAYEASRTTYYNEDNTPMDNMSSADMSASSDMSNSSEMSATDMAGDGGKVKVKADGDVKIKDAEGNKMKIDGDDGTIKEKPVDGGKTKIK